MHTQNMVVTDNSERKARVMEIVAGLLRQGRQTTIPEVEGYLDRVQKGVEYLNDHHTDWFKVIDPYKVNVAYAIGSPLFLVLFASQLDATLSLEKGHWSRENGFRAIDCLLGSAEAEVLNDEWKCVIACLRCRDYASAFEAPEPEVA